MSERLTPSPSSTPGDGSREWQQFLCCALADDAAWHEHEAELLWQKIGDELAWAKAKEHEAEGSCVLALTRERGARAPEQWSNAAEATRRQITAYLAALDRVANRLAADEIALVALKNSGIARGIFPHPEACPMGDVDTLVSRKDFRRAHELMLELGATLESRSPLGEESLDEMEASGGAEYRLPLENGEELWFELQWRVVGGRWVREDQEPKADELLARSVAIPGTAVRLLAPEDNLMQVCLHTAKHSYVRAPGLRLHTDVDRIVRRCAIDWDRFCTMVEAAEVRTAVVLSLMIPAEILRTPVSREVMERLGARTWRVRYLRRWIDRVGLFHPHARKWSRPGYIVFNAMLYDSLRGLLRGIFPATAWMQERYGFRSRWQLPYWHVVRLCSLVFRRART